MGLPFVLRPEHGPTPEPPIRRMEDVERLNARPDPERFRAVRELLGRVREELRGELPVIVFAGAPFTVATYCIGTGKDMQATRQFIAEQPGVWHELLDRLTGATIHILTTLVREGADVYQLFDSWAGMLDAAEYERYAQPQHTAIFTAVRDLPRILFVKECPYLDRMVATGADVISLGSRHDLAAARRTYPQLVFQGNVDAELLRNGTPKDVADATRRCLAAGGGQRHILNLNHGVDRATPVANFEAYVATAKAFR
jgi:uroporphyrinogen decarboxylase